MWPEEGNVWSVSLIRLLPEKGVRKGRVPLPLPAWVSLLELQGVSAPSSPVYRCASFPSLSLKSPLQSVYTKEPGGQSNWHRNWSIMASGFVGEGLRSLPHSRTSASGPRNRYAVAMEEPEMQLKGKKGCAEPRAGQKGDLTEGRRGQRLGRSIRGN